MSNYKHGDVVVMYRDFFEAYEGECLTYVRPDESLSHRSVLQKIDGSESSVPNHSFHLRDKPEFKIGDLIEASNHEDFEIVDQVYFVGDASKVIGFCGAFPIIATSDKVSISYFKYARKHAEKTYTIKHDCVEYNVSREIKERFDEIIKEAQEYTN